MLCPSCGTDVGDKLALCQKCEQEIRARHQKPSESSGAQIGAIRPAIKVVRLKPGEQHPNAPQQSSQSQHFGGAAAEIPRQPEERQLDRSALRPQRARSSVPANILVIAVLVIILAAWSFVWLVRSPKELSMLGPSKGEDTPQNFSHIVIHEKKDVVVDGQAVLGAFTVDGVTVALERVQIAFNQPKNYLELTYFSKEGPPPPETTTTPPPAYDPDKPILHVVLQFGPLIGKLDRDKLLSYLIEYFGGPSPLRVLNTYRKQLASFGEITSLSGLLKPGETIHGEMNNHRAVESDGKTVETSWTLIFNGPLELQSDPTPAAKKPAAPSPKK